jgi:hypothetical protein
MFLSSDAARGPGSRRCQGDWTSTTLLLVSHDWDPARDGAEALAGRRLNTALLEAGARVHVLAGAKADEEPAHPRYEVTVAPRGQLARAKAIRAWQMVRSTVPEAAGQWVDAAVSEGLKVLSAMPSDTVIYSRASPGASNIVGWHLARRSGLPWLAHFSDEWPPFQLTSARKKWAAPYKLPLFAMWRRRILREAGALTFTNPLQGDAVLGPAADRYHHKAFVVAHLPGRAAPARPQQFDTFHLVHSGNFYPPSHSAATLMQGLRLFIDRTPAARGRVKFTQAGWANGDVALWATRCRLEDVAHYPGRLSQPDLLNLLDSASLLIAVDYARASSRVILSKLPDYVNARRPILAITEPGSSMARFFEEDGAGLTASFTSPDRVAECIAAVFNAWTAGRSDAFLPSGVAVDSFSPSRVLTEFGAAVAMARRSARPPRASAPAAASAGAA